MRRHPPAWLAWPVAGVSAALVGASVAAVWLWPGLAETHYAESAVVYTVGVLWFGAPLVGYRLYEIDRIVSRTVSYALLSGVLGGIYVTSVLLLSRLLAPLGAGSVWLAGHAAREAASR